MPRPRWNRTRVRPRATPALQWRKRILVVCEGEKTECEYLKQFSQAHRTSKVKLDFARERGVPKTLVDIAKGFKARSIGHAEPYDEFDEFWCVFDIDDHPNIADAVQTARDNGIELAISNPCFELWLLLHFRDPPGQNHRNAIVELLRKSVPNYNKHVDYVKDGYADGYLAAVNGASHLDRLAEQAHDVGRNPTTGVYRLTESIRTE